MPARKTWSDWVGLVARLVLAGVFLYAGGTKVGNPSQFTVAIKAYQLLPDTLEKTIAYGLPVLELAIGVLLLIGLATRLAAAVSGVLLVAFLIGVSSAAARGLSIDCGCFGGGGAVAAGQTNYTLEIVRDAVLLLVAAYLVALPYSKFAVDDQVRAGVADAPDPTTRRTASAKVKAEAAQARVVAERDRRTRITALVAAAVLVVVTGVGIAVQNSRVKPPDASVAKAASYTGPVTKPAADGITVGYDDAKVTLDLYEDFMCPICGAFEHQTGPDVIQLAIDHKAKLRFHMLNFLDGSSQGTQYSTRAATIAACTAEQGSSFLELHALLYANQPKEGSTGLTDDQLLTYAAQAGADKAKIQTCLAAKTYATWSTDQNTAASQVPDFQGTPTVILNGQQLDWQSTEAVVNAVNAAAAS